MNPASTTRQQLLLWGLILGLWGLLVLVFAGQLYLSANLPWPEAILASLRDWYPWLLLGPIAAWLASTFPLERQRFKISVPIHVIGCIAAVFLYGLMVPRPPMGRGGPLGAGGGGPPFRWRGGAPEQLPSSGPDSWPSEGGPRAQPPFPPNSEAGIRHMPDQRSFYVNRAIMQARFNVPLYWVIVSVVHALTYYRRSQERERNALELEGRLAEAKLQTLQMQLHPHFLFNTLNAIATLVHKDPQAADEMIGNLSELLRATLETAQQEIPLRQELVFLDRYLEIQQVRFGDRLRIEKRIDASALDGQVPTLILQPLVENAIRHGIEPQPGTGLVRIRADLIDGRLQLEVADNGKGLKEASKSADGIGLSNTRARLQALYGNAARLVIESGADGGCSVQLQLPYRDENPNRDRG